MTDANGNGIPDDLEGIIAAIAGAGLSNTAPNPNFTGVKYVDTTGMNAETARETRRGYLSNPRYTFDKSKATVDSNGTPLNTNNNGNGGTATNTSYRQFNALTFMPIGINAAEAALGRRLNAAEEKRYRDALNKAEKANKTVTTQTTRGTNSSTRTTGGVDEQSFVLNQLENTGEGQAYHIGSIFTDAMRVLADRIG